MSKPAAKGLLTIIGPDSVFEGTIKVGHDIRIDGTLRGKVETSEGIYIGQNGIVEADIQAKTAIIGGRVKGNVVVLQRVELESTSTLYGDLKAKDLVINEGAIFQGNCHMGNESTTKV